MRLVIVGWRRAECPQVADSSAGDPPFIVDGSHWGMPAAALSRITQFNWKRKRPAHSATADYGCKAVAAIERCRFFHHAIYVIDPNNLTKLSGD
jgi:hypothetical protein